MRTTDAAALVPLGWDDDLAALVPPSSTAAPGRVARVDRGLVTVLVARGPARAEPGVDALAVGDWVLVSGRRVVGLLPRHSVFVRGEPFEGAARGQQVVAANVDVVFLVHALTNGPRIRRLERELVLVYESGARPVVVLNKADAVDDVEPARAAVARVAAGVDVAVTSARTGRGIDELHAYGAGNRTIALVGASGVGKSTIVNRLVGADVQVTAAVRARDQRGRHTTTARELVLLPGGGVLVDTPGLRAVSLWDADDGFTQAFADIERLAATCRFSDCTHVAEPGCAVRDAIARGELDAARLEHYRRLDAELDEADRRREARVARKALKRP